jgi:hypothetical protein
MSCKKCYGRGYIGFNIFTGKTVVCPDCFEEKMKEEKLKEYMVKRLIKEIVKAFITLPGYIWYTIQVAYEISSDKVYNLFFRCSSFFRHDNR